MCCLVISSCYSIYLMNVGAIRRWRTSASSLERAAVNNPALRAVAKNVHDIDLKENKFGRTEVAGLRGALGLSAAAAVAMFRFKVVMFQPWRRLSRRGWQDQAHRGDGRERYA